MDRLKLRNWTRIAVATALVGLTAAAIGLVLQGSSDGAATVQARLWPAFEMIYVYQTFSSGGEVVVDETHRLLVVDEHNWRDEVIAARSDPAETGSFREFKDGVLTSYNAKLKDSKQFPAPDGGIIVVNEFLNPGLLPAIKAGRAGTGWSSPSAAGTTLTAAQRASTTCSDRQGSRVCPEDLTVKWSSESLRPPFKGGIALTGERRIDGQLVARFEALSVEMKD